MVKTKSSHNRILIEIIIGIFIGILLGGFFPAFSTNLSFLGDIFLNFLMMIVVPVVMFSIITGITGIGNFKSLGNLGKNTIVYYIATTAISVLIGLLLVNLIKPGKQVTTGEKHPNCEYIIISDDNHVMELCSNILKKTDYDDKYKITLLDQQISGIIHEIIDNKIVLSYWIPRNNDDIVYLEEKSEQKHPFKIQNKKLVSAEPKVTKEGTGFEISLYYRQDLNDHSDILSTLSSVVIGDKKTGQEGMIPRNIFNAMLRMDILPLIIFSLLVGSVITVMGEKGKLLASFFSSLNELFMILTGWILEIAPFGILGLIASKIGQEGGFREFIPELIAVGKYSLTVLLGLGIHGIVVLPLILFIFAKRNPWSYFKGVATALLNAFSSASSSATLPLTIKEVENNNISPKTAGFVLPLGATINMDGTALYEAVAAMFIAQLYGISLGPVEQIIIFLTATLAAIGAAGIPQAGLVTMVIVLKAVNLPLEGIGMILTVDWLLDRFRTTVNVWGDSVGCAVVDEVK
jgi:Na+/H+-dicarboxylate symporter